MSAEGARRLRLHQKEFIEKLIDEMEQAVAKMLSKMTNDYSLVEDVMISVWTLACQKVEILERHENPQGWIMKSAKYKMLKALEKRNHISERELLVFEKMEGYLIEEVEMQIEWIDMLKSYLSQDEYTALILKFCYDVSYAELAEYFHINEAAVRKRVSRALRKLKVEMSGERYNKGRRGI